MGKWNAYIYELIIKLFGSRNHQRSEGRTRNIREQRSISIRKTTIYFILRVPFCTLFLPLVVPGSNFYPSK
jgi:hypothetical protein